MPVNNFDSQGLYLSIVDSAGTTRDISPHITGVDGLPGTKELIDVTAVGDSGRSYIASLRSGGFRVEGLYDNNASTGLDVILTGIFDMTSATQIIYAPAGNSSGATPLKRRITVNCWMRECNFPGRVGNSVAFASSFQIDGVPTFGTFT